MFTFEYTSLPAQEIPADSPASVARLPIEMLGLKTLVFYVALVIRIQVFRLAWQECLLIDQPCQPFGSFVVTIPLSRGPEEGPLLL